MDSVYESLPLDPTGQIRIINIAPGEENDPVVVSMTCVSLDDPEIQFQGLSYVWGDGTNPVVVYCNGAEFKATRNLHSSLRRLRQNKIYTLWIDAICINQNDRVERADQVKQTHRIYSQATPVWVDLGDPLPQQHQVFALMQKLVEVLGDDENDTRPIDYWRFESLGLPVVDDPVWAHWQELLARPYFRRVWVIQEFTLPKKLFILLGTTAFPWWNLYWITHRMNNRGISEDVRPTPGVSSKTRINAIKGWNGLRYMYQCHYTHHETALPLKTSHLLNQVRNVNATEPKDKVFGILGIAGDIDIDNPDFEIRYDDTETVVQLFTRVARGLIRGNTQEALGCLDGGGATLTSRLAGLPSWIPDWTAERAGKILGSEHAVYHAADNMELYAEAEGPTLRVRGRVIDQISSMTPTFQPDTENQHSDVYYGISVSRWLRDAFDLISANSPGVLSLKPEDPNYGAKDAMWRTLITNKTHGEQLAGPEYARYFENLLARQWFIDQALIDHTDDESLTIDDPDGAYHRADHGSLFYRIALQNSMYTKSFCITDRQQMLGMVPGEGQIGDYIVLISGSPVPFVMRKADPTKEGSREWILIQECYVHGIMNGKYAQEDNGAAWEEMVIV